MRTTKLIEPIFILSLASLVGCTTLPKPAPSYPQLHSRVIGKQLEDRVDSGRFGFSEEAIEETGLVSQVYTAKFALEEKFELVMDEVKKSLTESGTVQYVRPNKIIVTDNKDKIPGINSLMSGLGYKVETQTAAGANITTVYFSPKLEEIMPIVKAKLTKKGKLEVVGLDKLIVTDTEKNIYNIEKSLINFDFEVGEKITEESLFTKTYTIKNRDLESIKQIVTGALTERGGVQEIKPDRLIVKDTKTNLESLEKLLSDLDIKVPQVLIESCTYEVFKDTTADYSAFLGWAEREYSADISLPAVPDAREENIGTILGYVKETGDSAVKLFLDFLVSKGKAEIISKPWITVESGKKANIASGDEVPYRAYQVVSGTESFITTYAKALISLDVTPYVKENGYITMEITPKVDTITGYKGPEQMPVISTREAATTITLKSGETWVIGGLTKEEDREVRRGIPLLMDVPLAGNLFKSLDTEKLKTDVYISITPRIVDYGADSSTN